MSQAGRKRKAVTKDSASSEEVALADGLGNGLLHDILSQSEDESATSQDEDNEDSSDLDAEDEEDEADLDSDEVPSDDEDAPAKQLRREALGHAKSRNAQANGIHDDDSDHDISTTRAYTVTQDAHGNPRYVYRDIDPVYDSDDSDAKEATNTIGNIPLSFYDSYPHIGYDIDGKKVMRPAKGAALDALLESIEVPKGWTGLTDPATGEPLKLSTEELNVLKRLTRNELPEGGYDPYPDMIEYFSGRVEAMPLSAAPEPKRRFIPSKHEAKRVMKMVKAIREGRILPYKAPIEGEAEDDGTKRYDIWADETPRPDHAMNVPAPKLPPPGYEESYHPPPEYLPDMDEKAAWAAAEDSDREKDFLPADHDALRKVPGYGRFVKDKFERCLDLYLAPRVRRSKLNIDPESLLPKLPTPEELRPFPSRCDIVFRGHAGRVRSLAVDPQGILLASGGDDGTVRLWALDTGRELWRVRLSADEAVNVVRWRPGATASVLAAACGADIFLMAPDAPLVLGADADAVRAHRELLHAGWQAAAAATASATPGKAGAATWRRPDAALQEQGVLVQVSVRSAVKVLSWHRRGDYFASVSPAGQSGAVAIHTLSRHQTQQPFRRLKGLAQAVRFHPSKPVLFVATQRTIRSYDLVAQAQLKALQPGARWISGFDVHPGGEHLVVASYDRKLLWMDLDLSPRPYKTLRYHAKAIRAARFHQGGYPLFGDASDDGSVQVFHGKVVGDLMENASIVPLKVLRGHEVVAGLGVLDLDWHPTEPWCVSAGADGTCRLWRP